MTEPGEVEIQLVRIIDPKVEQLISHIADLEDQFANHVPLILEYGLEPFPANRDELCIVGETAVFHRLRRREGWSPPNVSPGRSEGSESISASSR